MDQGTNVVPFSSAAPVRRRVDRVLADKLDHPRTGAGLLLPSAVSRADRREDR
jgi:hypothetical protein